MGRKPTWVTLLIVALVLVGSALGITTWLLSNMVEFQGDLAGGVIHLSDIGSNGLPGVLTLINDTLKEFTFNATNRVNRTVDFNLSLLFMVNGIVNGGFEVLGFNWSINGVYLNDTPTDCSECALTDGTWRDYYPEVLAPFETKSYTVSVVFVFRGSGSYLLRASALNPDVVP